MRLGFLVLVAVVFGACGDPRPACKDGQTATGVPNTKYATAGWHPFGHSHNDYEHSRPLEDALDARFYSVEADLWYDDGKLTVSHNGWGAKGTLKDLYLDPLQALVSASGSVHGDGVPFTLWIDLKENHSGFNEALNTLLNGYSMLTSVDGGTVTNGPVTVVLTGDSKAKEAFVTLSPRRAFRDSNDYTPDDPPADNAWQYYALDWGKYLRWNGDGSMSDEDRQAIACITVNAHANQRKVRFYNSPDKASGWQVLLDNGVDFIHTDNLTGLESFLEAAP